jgi:cellulose synthase/poly-beta-1,6-N-acetylglucosamine synthase-like glycosyltransferase
LGTFVNLVAWTASLVFCLYGYDLVVSVAGFFHLALPPGRPGRTSFAVLICAHNEERVVAQAVRCMVTQQYDPERLRVFVVADHCSDRTAEVARAAGATVLERSGEVGRTKGYAMQWGIERIREIGHFDALCVIDADNYVPPDFVETISRYLDAGHVAVQGYLDTKNPTQTWVTRSIATAYHVTNRFWFRARARLGLPATLGGTGFCLAWTVVDAYPWDPGSLADDLELTIKLILDDVPVSYAYYARTYDEKPANLRLSLRQRCRWMQGHNDVAFRWLWSVLRATLTKRRLAYFDALLHLLQPLRMLVSFVCLVLLAAAKMAMPNHPAIARTFYFSVPAIMLALAVFVVYPLVVAAAERRFGATLRILVPFMMFSFTWIVAIVVGLVKMRRRVWIHTAHGT